MQKPVYWFPAKRFGWGWGLPTVWQGWVVFVAFFVLLAVGAVILLPGGGHLEFAAYAALLVLVLLVICLLKGEPPAWRSGR
jgi:asparagine N-glycosylation enzyme membrane subunit Stt3